MKDYPVLTENSTPAELNAAIVNLPLLPLTHMCHYCDINVVTRAKRTKALMDAWETKKATVLAAYNYAVALRIKNVTTLAHVAQAIVLLVANAPQIKTWNDAVDLLNKELSKFQPPTHE